MKRLLLAFCIVVTICLTSCYFSNNEYIPNGEFYIKTSSSRGDAGASEVISVEAEKKSYSGEGDITISLNVGFGHLPGYGGYSDETEDTFYVMYKMLELSEDSGFELAWEMKVEYDDSWYDSKYNSTEPENRSFLIIPIYGEFYPLYKENVELLFPKNIEYGVVEIEIYTVREGYGDQLVTKLDFGFEHINGALILCA